MLVHQRVVHPETAQRSPTSSHITKKGLQWLAGIPDHNPAEYLNNMAWTRHELVDSKQRILSWFCLWCLYIVFLNFMWFHFSRCFQMFIFSSLEKIKIYAERLRLAASCSRRALPPSVLLVSYMPSHVPCGEFFRGISQTNPFPIGSMYGIYANIGGIFMVNVTIYSIHGSYGFGILFQYLVYIL